MSRDETFIREFTATAGHTMARLVGGAALAAAGVLVLIVSFQWPGGHAAGRVGGILLVAGIILCVSAVRRSNVRVQIDAESVTLLDGARRQSCRWDEVVELYEANVNSSGDLWDILTGWARGEHHKLTLMCKAGPPLELKNATADFSTLVDFVKGATLTHLLPPAQAAFAAGAPIKFGRLTIDRQEVHFGEARLRWADVESISVAKDDGKIKVRKRGKFFAWATLALNDGPNAQVLLALAHEQLKATEESSAVDGGEGAEKPSKA
jgi:hypothetical protein